MTGKSILHNKTLEKLVSPCEILVFTAVFNNKSIVLWGKGVKI
jgi:hypothetical protein